MTLRRRRTARRAALGLALAGLVAGCGQSTAGSPTGGGTVASSASALSSFDMCTVLSAEELSALGVDPASSTPLDLLGQVGCQYGGDPFGLSLERDAEETVEDYAGRPENYVSFTRNEVNGRPGAQLQVRPSRQECAQLMDAGTGSALVDVSNSSSLTTIDPCAEALRIAQLIEPELPAVGS